MSNSFMLIPDNEWDSRIIVAEDIMEAVGIYWTEWWKGQCREVEDYYIDACKKGVCIEKHAFAEIIRSPLNPIKNPTGRDIDLIRKDFELYLLSQTDNEIIFVYEDNFGVHRVSFTIAVKIITYKNKYPYDGEKE